MQLPVVITTIDRTDRISRALGLLRGVAPHALSIARDLELAQSGGACHNRLPAVTVEQVMRTEIVTIRPETSVIEVVELLWDTGSSALPVIDELGQVVGIVSDHDLLTRGGMGITMSVERATDADFARDLQESLEDPRRRVSEVMTTDVRTVAPDELLGRAAKIMVEKRLKRLPVVDDSGKLLGILVRFDVLNTLSAVHLPEWHSGALGWRYTRLSEMR
jgi:CBS domain-containing protein